MWQPGQDDPATGAHDLEGVIHGLGSPCRLDDAVDAFAAGEPARDRLERAVARGVHRLGAELEGKRKAPVAPADTEHARAP